MQIDHSVGIIPVFTREDGQFYFCLVRHAAGHWAFPKGHKEEGETDDRDVALRELAEETGIVTTQLTEKIFTECYSFERDGSTVQKTVTYFLGLVPEMDDLHSQQRKEIMEAAWVPYDIARERITFPESKALLDEVRKHLTAKE